MNNLRELRKNKKMTQTELAKVFSTTTSNISGWECGKWQPDNDTLLKLANYFGVSIEYLIGHDALTQEERAAGLTETRKISITPIEGEMLTMFREIGKKYGEDAQRSIILMTENMLKLK